MGIDCIIILTYVNIALSIEPLNGYHSLTRLISLLAQDIALFIIFAFLVNITLVFAHQLGGCYTLSLDSI